MGNRSSSSTTGTDELPPDGARPRSASQTIQQSQSYYSMLKEGYQSLVNAIIRPPRSQYDVAQLGPIQFPFCDKMFHRRDFELVNDRNLRICCSQWSPVDQDRPSNILPCVVYMHGNSSSRLEALGSLSLVLSIGATLLSFDFAGSGMSEGEYVSLGVFEKDDLQCVIEHLRSEGRTSTIALWGRSMGAATALLHGERDPSIAALVLDSAFANLVLLAEEMVETGRQQGLFAPGILVRIVLNFIRSSVLKAADFDIRKLAPIDSAEKCYIPAMLIAAENDRFVRKSHSMLIYERYGGDKNLVLVEGDHNSRRPRFLYDSIGIFLTNTLQIPEDWLLPGSDNFIRKNPWQWSRPSSARLYVPFSEHPNRDSSSNEKGSSATADAINLNGVELSFDDLVALHLSDSDASRTLRDQDYASYDNRAELEMQASMQSSLFQLFNGSVSACKSNVGAAVKANTEESLTDSRDPIAVDEASDGNKRRFVAASAGAADRVCVRCSFEDGSPVPVRCSVCGADR